MVVHQRREGVKDMESLGRNDSELVSEARL